LLFSVSAARYHRAAIAGTDGRAYRPGISGTGDAHVYPTTITGADCPADRAAAETNMNNV